MSSSKDIYNLPREELPKWIKTQIKVFSKWVNLHLSKRSLGVEDIQTDFKSGANLINLIEILSGETCKKRWSKKPRFTIQYRENVSIALDFLVQVKASKTGLVNVGSADITEGNLKIILGLIWILINRYQVSSDKNSNKKTSGQKELLNWIKSRCEGNEDVIIGGFKDSFCDGKAFITLIDKQKPGQLKNTDNMEDEERLTYAFDQAKELMEIPKLLEPSDLTGEVDDLSVITYCSYYRNYSLENEDEEQAEEKNVPEKISGVECIERQCDSLRIQWEEPEEKENKDIKEYFVKVLRKDSKSKPIELRTIDPEVLIEGLGSNEEVVITVCGINEKGEEGDESKPLKVKTLGDAPKPIKSISLLSKVASRIVVKWEKPENSGGKIDNYEIEIIKLDENDDEEEPIVANSDSELFKISNLKPLQKTKVRIRAHNDMGFGEWSEPCLFQSSSDIPSQVENIYLETEKTTNEKLVVKWDPPKDNGEPIDYYQVSIKSGQSKKPKVVKTKEPIVEISDLMVNKKVAVLIKAHNDNGFGKESKPFNCLTKSGVPLKVDRIFCSKFQSTKLDLMWNSPKDQGSPIDKYKVEAIPQKSQEKEKKGSGSDSSSSSSSSSNDSGIGSDSEKVKEKKKEKKKRKKKSKAR
eukprot:Anaeramoba_flamelloidesa325155_517.p2 GENE.a325155_517~~a325155_517.p2  ORF type:complete len:639 (-),score=194.49 a325155_517:10997-12913(-)